MENLNKFGAEEDRSNGPRQTLAIEEARVPENNKQLLIDKVLSTINTITNQTEHLTEALNAVKHDWSDIDWVSIDEAIAEKIAAIVDAPRQMVYERESTNRESLRILEKMLDKMTKKPNIDELSRLSFLGVDWAEVLGEMNKQERITFLQDLMSL